VRYGQRKSFQRSMNVSSPRTAAAGRRIGKTTETKIRVVDAPSTRAASMSSSGIAWAAYCRMRKTPKPLTRKGSSADHVVPASPSRLMSM
jgi:hypothetical protein